MLAPRPVNDLLSVWSFCEELLRPAIERSGGLYTANDVLRLIIEGQMQLFVGEKSVIVTQIVNFPRKKLCVVVLAGGSLEEIVSKEPELVTWAKGLGCERIRAEGRDGWARALPGYKSAYRVVDKDI